MTNKKIYEEVLKNAKSAETCTYGIYPKIMTYNVFKLDGTSLEKKPSDEDDPVTPDDPVDEYDPWDNPSTAEAIEVSVDNESKLREALSMDYPNIDIWINNNIELTEQLIISNTTSNPDHIFCNICINLGNDISLNGNINDPLIINRCNSLSINGNGNIYNTNTSKQGNDAFYNDIGASVIISGNTFGTDQTTIGNTNHVNRGAAVRNLGYCRITGGKFTAIDNNYISGGYAYALINGSDNSQETKPTMHIDGENITVFGSMNGCVANNAGVVEIYNGDFNVNTSHSTKSYYAIWTTNDGDYTRTTIYGGTYHGVIAAVCTGVDDDNQDRSTASVTIVNGSFAAESGTPIILTKKPSVYGLEISINGGKYTGNGENPPVLEQFFPPEDDDGYYFITESGDENYPWLVDYHVNPIEDSEI